jgi:ribonuclease HI
MVLFENPRVQREPRVIVRTARGSGGYAGHVGYLVENPGRVPDLPMISSLETGVPQGSPVSPILFIIYLSGIFEAIEAKAPIEAISFVDDIGLLASGNSIQEVSEILEMAGTEAISWGIANNVSFEVNKTEAVLFTKKRGRALRQSLSRAKITLDGSAISYNQDATRWLGIWLDSGLTLKSHYQIRLQKAKNAEARLRSISSTYGLAPGLVRRIQIAAVQSVALYGAELWWKGQKTWAQDIQKMVNRQARAITGALKTTPIGPLVKEATMTPAIPLLNNRQRRYAVRALKLPVSHPINNLLPSTLRYGDGDAQPGEYSSTNLQWAERDTNPKGLGQRLARTLARELNIDPSEGFEWTTTPQERVFPGEIHIHEAHRAEEEARRPQEGLALWSDGSRLESKAVGAGITWKIGRNWKEMAIPLGRNKEVFDAELYGIQQAIRVALKGGNSQKGPVVLDPGYSKVIVFSDSQAAIRRVKSDYPGAGQTIAKDIIAKTAILAKIGISTTIKWVPSHIGIEGNERADKLAKKGAEKPINQDTDKHASFAYLGRLVKEQARKEKLKWLQENTKKPYNIENLKGVKAIFSIRKLLAKRFFQLKLGHAITANYLFWIRVIESKACWWCKHSNQTINHLLFECRHWRPQRRVFYRELMKKGIGVPTMAELDPRDRLFNHKEGLQPILNFLASTEIGIRPKTDDMEMTRGEKADRWDINLIGD